MRQVDVRQAHDLLLNDEYTYVDVRSVTEYRIGHPSGAVNVPLLHYDEQLCVKRPNPQFLAVMQANFPKDAKLLIGCQAGLRSLKAAQLLQAAGYTNVANVRGGFGGGFDHQTGVLDAGWVQSGLPVDDAPPPGGSYEELARKVCNG
jgi:rhodanese-related sulfurtransferase